MENRTHDCSYNNKYLNSSEELIAQHIDSGYCIPLRRKFRRLLVVSEKNVDTQFYLRSRAAFREEFYRHVRYFYYIIHPFSDGITYWNCVMLGVFVSLFIIIPVDIIADSVIWPLKITKFILDVMCCMDICIRFCTGYYDYSVGEIVLDRRRIVKRYLWGYFWADVLSSLPIDFIIHVFQPDPSGRCNHPYKLLGYLKAFRIITCVKAVDRPCQVHSMEIKFYIEVMKLSLLLTVFGYWLSSLTYIIGAYRNEFWLPQEHRGTSIGFLKALHKAVSNLFACGTGYVQVSDTKEMVFIVLCLTIGYATDILLYGIIAQILFRYKSASHKYKGIMQQVREYTRYKNLPETIRNRIFLFYDFRFQKKYFNEPEILNSLSAFLREEIRVESCKHLLQSVVYLKFIPASVQISLLQCLKPEFYLPNDVIVGAGKITRHMYFIHTGTVAVFLYTGKELSHLTEGEHFGEKALLGTVEGRLTTVVAVECCEVYSLDRIDFEHCFADYPELKERTKQILHHEVARIIHKIQS